MADSLPEHLQELLAGYVLGNLSSEEAEELRQLLVSRPELSTEAHQLQEALAAMPYGLPEVALPPALKSSVLNTVVASPKAAVRNSRERWLAVGGGIAALVAVAFGLGNYHLQQQLAANQTQLDTLQAQLSSARAQAAEQRDLLAKLQQPTTQLVVLKAADRRVEATGNAVLTPGEPGAILVLQNLPVLPEGQFYQLWSIVDDEKLASGHFNSNQQGKVFVKLPVSATKGITSLAITIEVVPEPKQPSGPLVLSGQV